ncbi:MAG: hypothetical protein JNL97_08875, partial [Verrucomicrobiales bacterium]|nr:hypothetical protein [Verrucomicrobiales bacterium]
PAHAATTNVSAAPSRRNIALFAALATLLMTGSAGAVVVTIDGMDYDITTLTGTFDDNASVLTAQPWYGDETLANRFVDAVGARLGLPHDAGNSVADFLTGPMFAWTDNPPSGNPNAFRASTWVRSAYFGFDNQSFAERARYFPYTFAVVNSGTHGVPDLGSTWLLLSVGLLGVGGLRGTAGTASRRTPRETRAR